MLPGLFYEEYRGAFAHLFNGEALSEDKILGPYLNIRDRIYSFKPVVMGLDVSDKFNIEKKITLVVIREAQSLRIYGLIRMKTSISESNPLWPGVAAYIESQITPFKFGRVGEYGVIFQEGTPWPVKGEHSPDREEKILSAFNQSSGEAFFFAIIPDEVIIKSFLDKASRNPTKEEAELYKNLSLARWIAGFINTGTAPSLSTYVRMRNPGDLANLSKAYQSLQNYFLRLAKEKDQENRAKGKTGKISEELVIRRINSASQGKIFGRVFSLVLRTNNLREITAAIIQLFTK